MEAEIDEQGVPHTVDVELTMTSENTPMSDTIAAPPTPREQILQACAALFPVGQVTELRVLDVDGRDKKNASGWFTNWERLADAAVRYEQRRASGIYIIPNPLHEGCLARSQNSIRDWVKTTSSDRDVTHRHWLMIDLDPERPAAVSSTETELTAAIERAKAVITYLEYEVGFPAGIRARSGNGFHLLYRIDLPSDDQTKELISLCLQGLQSKFSGAGILIDTTVSNAARIWKLYGTLARKGENTEDRPHRRSELRKTNGEYPIFGALGIVPPAALEILADVGRSATPSSARTAAGVKKEKSKASGAGRKPAALGEYYIDLDGFVSEHGLHVTRQETFDGTGLRYILDACVFDSSHTGTSACLGRSKTGRVFYKCQHDSCSGKGWSEVKALFKESGNGSPKPKAGPEKTTAKKKTTAKTKPSTDDKEPWQLAGQFVDEEWTDADTGQVSVRRHREAFYRYDAKRKCYREVPEDSIRVSVVRWLGERISELTTRKSGDVLGCIRAIVTTPAELELPFYSKIDTESGFSQGDPQKHHWITLKNGILDIDAVAEGSEFAKCLYGHTSEWFSVTSLPFPFPVSENQVECPTWLAFLAETMQNGDGEPDQGRIDLLQEAFGYCLMPETYLEAFFVFHGPGRNGKSTVLNILRTLLGDDNVASLSIEQLSGIHGTTHAYQLIGKLANLCSDLNEMDRVSEGMLKSIVSGDQVTVRRLYKDPIQFRPSCKLFFATNVLPRFNDTSLGIWRRMQLIPFDYIVPAERMDVHLLNHLEEEMPGILVWALQGMLRLRKRRRFTQSKRCQAALRDYRLQCFPIFMFLEECCKQEGDCTAGQLWKAYRQWCDNCGLRKPKPLHAFLRDVCGFWQHVQYTRAPSGMEANRQLFGISVSEIIGIESAVMGSGQFWPAK